MRKMLIVTVAVCMLLSSCDGFGLPYGRSDMPPMEPYVEFDRAAFVRSQDRWEARGITDYTFEVFQYSGWKVPVCRVTVMEGEITDIEFVEAWHLQVPEDMAEGLKTEALHVTREIGTIPAMFGKIEALYIQAVESLPRLKKGDGISCHVTYDEVYGFPEEVRYGIFSPSPPEGGRYRITVRNFRPLQAAK